MTALGVTLVGIGAMLVWAGFTATNLWAELVAVFGGSSSTTTPPTRPQVTRE